MMDLKKEQGRTPERTSFFAALCAGILTHGFALFNTFSNYDNIAQLHSGFGTGIESGRWFLEILIRLCHWLKLDYNLPAVNGLLLILLLAISAAFAVSAFSIKSPCSAGILGVLFVVFPTVTSTMIFRYTAFPYGLGIFLSVLAAWVLSQKGVLFLSGLLTALSLGIYQAYAPVTITIFLIQLIVMSLEEGSNFWAVVRQGLYRCAALLVGIALYYFFLKFFLVVFHLELNDYQGMQNMGKLSLATIPILIRQAYIDFITMPLRNYCGLANTPLLSGSYLVLALISGIIVLFSLIRRKKVTAVLLTGGLCALLPLAVNFIVIMCPESYIYTLMVYAFVLVPCFPLVLLGQSSEFDRTFPAKVKSKLWKLTAITTILVAFLYGYYANVNYTAQHRANQHMEYYASSILTQARTTPGFDAEKKWIFVGNNQDPMYYFAWDDELIYGGSASPAHLMNTYSSDKWFWYGLGFRYPYPTEEEKSSVIASEEVKAMPCWPSYGSMQVLGDYLVIKFEDIG